MKVPHLLKMEWLIIGLFVSAVSYFLNQGERAAAKQDALDIQHDSQEFESAETDKARQFQEDFYLKYQSPEALMSQYRSLGASETASLMSALGLSPSLPSAVKASSSPAGGLGTGVNTMSDLLNSLTGGFNQMMQGQKSKEETKWVGAVNDANIKATLGQLEIHWKQFGLQKDSFEQISKPLAQMSLDKTRQEIEESKQRMKQSEAQILQIEQQIMESKQNINESNARIDLLNAQTETEGFKQQNLAADTSLKDAQQGLVESQTEGQDIQNALDSIALAMSQNLGMDVRLNWMNQTIYAGGKFFNETFNLPWQEFSKSVSKTFDGLLHGMDMQDLSHKALDYTERFMSNPFYPHYNVTKGGFKVGQSYQQWLRKRGKKWKAAEDWINKNTRYGM